MSLPGFFVFFSLMDLNYHLGELLLGWGTYLRISCKVGVLAENSLSFYFSGNGFFFFFLPSFIRGSLARYKFLADGFLLSALWTRPPAGFWPPVFLLRRQLVIYPGSPCLCPSASPSVMTLRAGLFLGVLLWTHGAAWMCGRIFFFKCEVFSAIISSEFFCSLLSFWYSCYTWVDVHNSARPGPEAPFVFLTLSSSSLLMSDQIYCWAALMNF